MRIDGIRGKITNPFLYKRFAYNSEGFIELMKFLEEEDIINEFYKECSFERRLLLANDLNCSGCNISLRRFFANDLYSFTFAKSQRGYEFWYNKIFKNKNFEKIKNKFL